MKITTIKISISLHTPASLIGAKLLIDHLRKALKIHYYWSLQNLNGVRFLKAFISGFKKCFKSKIKL
jgi:hypothetical protein